MRTGLELAGEEGQTDRQLEGFLHLHLQTISYKGETRGVEKVGIKEKEVVFS